MYLRTVYGTALRYRLCDKKPVPGSISYARVRFVIFEQGLRSMHALIVTVPEFLIFSRKPTKGVGLSVLAEV